MSVVPLYSPLKGYMEAVLVLLNLAGARVDLRRKDIQTSTHPKKYVQRCRSRPQTMSIQTARYGSSVVVIKVALLSIPWRAGLPPRQTINPKPYRGTSLIRKGPP